MHQQAAHGDRHVYASRSRFIPESVAKCFDEVAWPIAGGAERASLVAAQPRVDIAARMRKLWQ
jgi:DNA helicase-2/ATP-dependent DNA helicase PcrA